MVGVWEQGEIEPPVSLYAIFNDLFCMYKSALIQLGEHKKHVVESGKASTTTATSTTTE